MDLEAEFGLGLSYDYNYDYGMRPSLTLARVIEIAITNVGFQIIVTYSELPPFLLRSLLRSVFTNEPVEDLVCQLPA